jgi:digeranylgeranylglycerophospholipid reductase
MNCDILIVGAGPAGSSAALEASKTGARVLMVEKKKTIGQPVQCAELLPESNLLHIKVTPRSFVQEIKRAKYFPPQREYFEEDFPCHILDRTVFDKELAVQAAHEGAHILVMTRCISKRGEQVILKKGEKRIEVSPKVIIGADGPRSTVGTWIARVNREFCTALQYEVPLVCPSDCVEFYFDHQFFGGYGWLFPKGEVANVGVAIKHEGKTRSSDSLDYILNKFTKRLQDKNKIKGNPVSITGGLIPVGGPLQTVRENIILAGDAAGQTDPLTGGGIVQAFICGKIAGRTAAEAVKNNDLHLLHTYEVKWRSLFENDLKRTYAKRQFLESHWDELDSIIGKGWTLNKEHYTE